MGMGKEKKRIRRKNQQRDQENESNQGIITSMMIKDIVLALSQTEGKKLHLALLAVFDRDV